MKNLKRGLMWAFLYYLRFWARLALRIGKPRVVGVAGSVGKSSMKEILHAMLIHNTHPTYTYGNSETGVPLGILGIDAGGSGWRDWLRIALLCPISIFTMSQVDVLIVEMGTDEPAPPKNMEYLLTIVKPDISVLLNTFPIHTQQFSVVLDLVETKELAEWSEDRRRDYVTKALAKEDAKIITQNPGTMGIYNRDNALVCQQIETIEPNSVARLLSFGSNSASDISYGRYEVSLSGSQFELVQDKRVVTITVDGHLLPEVYREVLAAALLAGQTLGFTTEQLVNSLSQHFHVPKSRSTMLAGMNDSIIIDSSYNASARANIAFLDMLDRLKKVNKRPAVVILGDMRELGLVTESEHVQVAERLAEVADEVYLVGELTKRYVLPALQRLNPSLPVQHFVHSRLAGQELKKSLPQQAIVLGKGSQNTIYIEEALKEILLRSSDKHRMCRQEDYWLARKERWFKRSESEQAG